MDTANLTNTCKYIENNVLHHQIVTKQHDCKNFSTTKTHFYCFKHHRCDALFDKTARPLTLVSSLPQSSSVETYFKNPTNTLASNMEDDDACNKVLHESSFKIY